MKTLIKINNVLNTIAKYILITLFIVMTFSYTLQIFSRYTGIGQFHWTDELTRYAGAAMVFLGGAVISRTNDHINVSLVDSLIKDPKNQRYLHLLTNLLTIIFFGALIFLGFQFVSDAGTQLSTSMRIPMKIAYLPMPISFILLVFNSIMYLLDDVFEVGKEEVEQ